MTPKLEIVIDSPGFRPGGYRDHLSNLSCDHIAANDLILIKV
jgi:hypothetical protein